MALFDELGDALTGGSNLGALSSFLGSDDDKTKGLMGMAGPALLGALGKRSAAPGGADAIFNLAQGADDGILGNISGFLGGGDAGGMGGNLVGSLLGSRRGAVESGLAQQAGVGGGMVTKLLPMLAPMVMGFLKKKMMGGGMNAGGLASMLGDNTNAMRSGGLGGILDLLDGGDDEADNAGFLDGIKGMAGLGGATAAAGAVASKMSGGVGSAAGKVTGAASSVTGSVGDGVGKVTGGVDVSKSGGGGGMLKWLLPLLLLVALAALLFWACSGGDDEVVTEAYGANADCSASEDGLNIGTLLPETGSLAFLGDPLVEAVEMAICDINNSGGVNGSLVTLSRGDSGTDPDVANQTVDRLVSSENVDAIVGAAASGISGSVIDKITSAPAVQCSPSNTAAGLGVGGDDGYYFRTAPSDDLQAPALAELILEDGYASVAFVPRSDDWGVGLSSFFVPAFENGGGTVVYNTPYALEATSYDDVVADVIASGPDAVVLASFEEGLQIMRTMVEQGAGPADIPIYITDGMASGTLGADVDESNPGVVAGVKGTQPSASPEAGAAFFPDAFAAYAPGTDTIFSSQSYDCVITIALAAQAAGSNDAAAIKDAMVEVTRGGTKCSTFAACVNLLNDGEDIDFDGASGPIDFLDAGEPSVGAYDIYEYDGNGEQNVIRQLVLAADG